MTSPVLPYLARMEGQVTESERKDDDNQHSNDSPTRSKYVVGVLWNWYHLVLHKHVRVVCSSYARLLLHITGREAATPTSIPIHLQRLLDLRGLASSHATHLIMLLTSAVSRGRY